MFRGTRRTVALFLNRLFATDGWATVLQTGQAQLGFSTISERLARQVQHLLLRFGIIAVLKKRSVAYQGERRRAWQLDITDAESIRLFASEIGIFGKERALERVWHALSAKRPHSNRDLLPREVWKQIEAEKGELSWAEVARKMGIAGEGPNLHVGARGVSRKRLLRIAEALDSDRLRALATSDLYWDQIVSIEYLGLKQVYDLTIPETHNFVANDVCVHNTALALNIASHVAMNPKNPKAVAVFSLEMSKESLLTRMICAEARVDQQRFRAGYLNHEERSALQTALYKIVECPLFLDDTAGTNLMDVHSKLRRLQAEHDLGLVVVDYLQLMQGRGRFENRVQEISSLSRGFKLMSKELRVPFLVLSQLSRATETRQGDHRPILSDLRESGSIEQDADMVGFIFREEVYRPDKESLKGIAELILAKQRNGPTGRMKLAFLNRYTRFENLSADTGDEPGGFE
jgi:replicative DNA helicase